MNEWVLDVSGLNEYVARKLMADPVLNGLRLRGEISNFKHYPSGHWYFTLKDEKSRISCVMFRSNATRMSFRPQDGDQVIMTGMVRLYEEGGTYQFVAEQMRPEGTGQLYRRFEQLKDKLGAEGLFDNSRKRVLPLRPRLVAIVTSEAGAVLHDICRVARLRDPSVPLVLFPVSVQGVDAPEQIADAIKKAGKWPGVDVIIAGRGGGSLEDLWAFNEECVARAIASCPVPVVSAVGHETDFTIADFVADVRASTPSNAAEIVVPERQEMIEAFNAMKIRLHKTAEQKLNRKAMQLLQYARRIDLLHPQVRLASAAEMLRSYRQRINKAQDDAMNRMKHRISISSIKLDSCTKVIGAEEKSKLALLSKRIEALNPLFPLKRGYVLVTAPDGDVVTSAYHTPKKMILSFSDGKVRVHKEEEVSANT